MKSFRLVALSLFLLFPRSTFSQNWRVAAPYNGSINDIVFTDAKTGYACGVGAGIGLCTGSGLLLKTIDGGETWTRMNTVTTYALTKLFFVDAFTGWALGNSSTVLKTTDGGVTWVLQTFGVGAGYNDFYFADYNTGFLCGLNGILRRTVNGGGLYTTIASGVTTTLYGVHFVSPTIGFIIGDNGVIRKTTNGGTSFSNASPVTTDPFRDICFVTDSIGFVLSPYKILKTTNAGSSWTIYNAPPGSIMTRIHFVSRNVGFVIGVSGLLLKTTDGGNTWNLCVSTTTFSIRSIFFTDENTGYIGKDQGQIDKTTDGTASWNSILSGLSEELYSVHFRNRARGIAVGKYGGIYHTKNGGLNWTHRNTQTFPLLNCVRWLTDKKVISVGANGTLIKSDDTGLHWYQMNTGLTDNLYDIDVVDSANIYITFGTGKLMKTTDGGVSWDTTLNTSSPNPLSGVYFINRDTGYVCGGNEIYRTYNGGNSWTLKNDSVAQFTSFNDISFPSRDTGYVAGSFGQLYRTINGGEWWHAMYPGGTGNAEINEMQFVSNDTGYFAGLSSQRGTYQAGVNIGTLPTACLAGSGETRSIHIPEKGYGYCVGGLTTVQKDSMLATYLQDSIFCSGSKIFVGYLASGLLLSTQVLDVQLSDANGSFASPIIIGTFQIILYTTDPSGIATCTLPAGANGNGYRIRVVCNNPALISPDNGYNITIKSSNPTHVDLSLLNSKTCVGDTLRFSAQAIGGGTNPVYTWRLDNHLLDWEANDIGIDTLQGIHVLSVTMNSSLRCATSSATDSIRFEVHQNPSADAGADQSACAGIGAIFTIGTSNNNVRYNWFPSTGLNNDTIAMPVASPLVSQNYILTTTDSIGCIAMDSVYICINQLPSIHINGSTQLCSGDSALLTANTTIVNPAITWMPANILSSDTGSSVYVILLSDATVYVTIMDDSSCVNSDSISITLVPAAAIPILTIVNNSLVASVNTHNLIWYKDSVIITNFSNDTLYNPAFGNYWVKATDSNGCEARSQSIAFSNVGIEQAHEKFFRVYFYRGVLEITAESSASKNINVNLFDLSGRLILNNNIELDADGSGELEIKDITRGIYFSRIRSKKMEWITKIIID